MKNNIEVHVTQDSAGCFIATARRNGKGVSYDGDQYVGVEDKDMRDAAFDAQWEAFMGQEKKDFSITDQDELVEGFWDENPQWEALRGRKQNNCPCDVRMAWCEFVDVKYRNGDISERLADSAVLE